MDTKQDPNGHIPIEEIKQDILDTEREIVIMEREATAFEMLQDRLSDMRAHARRTGIKERKEFIVKLNKILELRGAPNAQT